MGSRCQFLATHRTPRQSDPYLILRWASGQRTWQRPDWRGALIPQPDLQEIWWLLVAKAYAKLRGSYEGLLVPIPAAVIGMPIAPSDSQGSNAAQVGYTEYVSSIGE